MSQALLIPGLGGRKLVEVPSGFDYTPPFNIYKRSNVRFETDINIDSYVVTPSVEYYLSPTGNDSNDGLSAGNPKKSLSTLVTAINAAPTPVTFILAPGTYVGTEGLQGVSIGFDCNILCPDGVAVFRPSVATSWTKTAGRTNLWETTQSGNPFGVDLTALDQFGIPKKFQFVSGGNLAIADAVPGSITISGTTAYVHTYDGREPDADVLVFATGTDGWVQTSARNVTVMNVLFWGWEQPVLINHGSGGRYVFSGCDFSYSRNARNGFETSVLATSGMLTIMHRCRAAYNRNDGFGYRGSQRAIEIDCLGVWNGWPNLNTNDNGTSTHDNVRSVRVNGTYAFNDDRNLHDINETRNWLLGCRVGFAQNGGTDPYDTSNFVFGRRGQTDATLAWLDGCRSLGGSASDLGSYGNSIVRVRNGVGLNITDGDGTIESY